MRQSAGSPRGGWSALLVPGLSALLVLAACGQSKVPAAAPITATTSAAKIACTAGGSSVANPPSSATSIGAPTNTPVQLIHGHTLAEVFTASSSILAVASQSPTWFTAGSGYTLTLLKGAGLKGATIACAVFNNATDNQWNELDLTTAAPAGMYTLEMAHPTGTATAACPGHSSEPNCSTTPLSGKTGGVIGWWQNNAGADSGDYSIINGQQTGGSFSIYYIIGQ